MKVLNFQTEGQGERSKYSSNKIALPTELYKGTLRSGQFLGAKGNLVVVGDVHSGAEIVAYGDIYVLGSLLGTAHAGAKGYDNSLIWAMHFQPTQVRIAEHITRPPDGEKKPFGYRPEIAFIKDGVVTIEAYPDGLLERRKFFERIMEGS